MVEHRTPRYTNTTPSPRPHKAHTTDIDALESVLHLLTHGDFAGTAEPADLGRVVYLMQLALQYLLYVQEQLASENATLRSTDSSGRQAALQLRVAELKQRLTLTQHELKRYRRTNKTYEVCVWGGDLCGGFVWGDTYPCSHTVLSTHTVFGYSSSCC